jgi:hypothetical protein
MVGRRSRVRKPVVRLAVGLEDALEGNLCVQRRFAMYFLFILPGLALSMWASARVKSTFNKYSKVRSARGFTGR